MPPPTADLHCLRLEETLTKLRKALDDWRTYSYEYEAFREEVLALPSSASSQAIVSIYTYMPSAPEEKTNLIIGRLS